MCPFSLSLSFYVHVLHVCNTIYRYRQETQTRRPLYKNVGTQNLPPNRTKEDESTQRNIVQSLKVPIYHKYLKITVRVLSMCGGVEVGVLHKMLDSFPLPRLNTGMYRSV